MNQQLPLLLLTIVQHRGQALVVVPAMALLAMGVIQVLSRISLENVLLNVTT